MDLKQYFDRKSGLGVLSTADADGNVNSAVYARPHVFDDGRIAFIMADRRSLSFVRSNPGAAYLFREDPSPDGKRFQGLRLKLKKLEEAQDDKLIESMRRARYGDDRDGRSLVYFEVEETRPLVGDEERGEDATGNP